MQRYPLIHTHANFFATPAHPIPHIKQICKHRNQIFFVTLHPRYKQGNPHKRNGLSLTEKDLWPTKITFNLHYSRDVA